MNKEYNKKTIVKNINTIINEDKTLLRDMIDILQYCKISAGIMGYNNERISETIIVLTKLLTKDQITETDIIKSKCMHLNNDKKMTVSLADNNADLCCNICGEKIKYHNNIDADYTINKVTEILKIENELESIFVINNIVPLLYKRFLDIFA